MQELLLNTYYEPLRISLSYLSKYKTISSCTEHIAVPTKWLFYSHPHYKAIYSYILHWLSNKSKTCKHLYAWLFTKSKWKDDHNCIFFLLIDITSISQSYKLLKFIDERALHIIIYINTKKINA